jgi:hypothetical protein
LNDAKIEHLLLTHNNTIAVFIYPVYGIFSGERLTGERLMGGQLPVSFVLTEIKPGSSPVNRSPVNRLSIKSSA